ncbi:hypothetical protein LL947_10975 [Halomonas sp. BLK-85]
MTFFTDADGIISSDYGAILAEAIYVTRQQATDVDIHPASCGFISRRLVWRFLGQY